MGTSPKPKTTARRYGIARRSPLAAASGSAALSVNSLQADLRGRLNNSERLPRAAVLKPRRFVS